MGKIYSFLDYSNIQELTEDFVLTDKVYKKDFEFERIQNDIIEKFNLKLNIIRNFKFYTFYSIIFNMLENQDTIESDKKKSVLLGITSMVILKNEEDDNEEVKAKSRSLLEELKLSGVGNGIVKNFIECIKIFFQLYQILYKEDINQINNKNDEKMNLLFSKIYFIVNKYNMTIDVFINKITDMINYMKESNKDYISSIDEILKK